MVKGPAPRPAGPAGLSLQKRGRGGRPACPEEISHYALDTGVDHLARCDSLWAR